MQMNDRVDKLMRIKLVKKTQRARGAAAASPEAAFVSVGGKQRLLGGVGFLCFFSTGF